ncbi:MAG: FlgD immunoglobulin-like domain containing protein, partial [bacterium]
YTLLSRAPDLGAVEQTVYFAGVTELNFRLPILSVEDFETGDFVSYPWAHDGQSGWEIDTAAQEGTYCVRSGPIGHGQETVLAVTLDVITAGHLSFYYRVSSEENYDFLQFSIDQKLEAEWSGAIPWSFASFSIKPGPHSFSWRYVKDGNVSDGLDRALLDRIEFPTLAQLPQPQLAYSPTGLEVVLPADASTVRLIVLRNLGAEDLEYSVALVEHQPARSVTAAATVPITLGKAAKDVRPGQAPGKGSGGPDNWGYRWRDSDDPDGPLFVWEELAGIGSAVTLGDDTVHGPFALGFSCDFYSASYDSIWICSNGFLSFAASSARYTNQVIPHAATPNVLLAPFWDDLDPTRGGVVAYHQDSENQRFIVSYDQVPHYGGADPETFQVVIAADGSLHFQYLAVTNDSGCTVGIENGVGDDGLQVVFNADYLHDELAIRFSAEAVVPWLSVSPVAGWLEPEGNGHLKVTFDSADLATATYRAAIELVSNDPLASRVSIPVTLVVDEILDGGGDHPPPPLALGTARPNPFNPSTVIPFSLPSAGRVELKIFDLAGRLIRTLVSTGLPAGDHEVVWNGQDDRGRGVASGTYYVRLVAGKNSRVKSLTLVR